MPHPPRFNRYAVTVRRRAPLLLLVLAATAAIIAITISKPAPEPQGRTPNPTTTRFTAGPREVRIRSTLTPLLSRHPTATLSVSCPDDCTLTLDALDSAELGTLLAGLEDPESGLSEIAGGILLHPVVTLDGGVQRIVVTLLPKTAGGGD